MCVCVIETPGALYKRLGDLDAPIISVPIWMYIPEKFLPSRAYIPDETTSKSASQMLRKLGKQAQQQQRSTTYLRSNLHRSVSVLDVVPTLRDLLNHRELFSHEQRQHCVTGQSLLSSTIAENRIVVGWHGRPIEGAHVGIMSLEDEAILYYNENVENSHIAKFEFDEENPFRHLYESNLRELNDTQRTMWREALQDQGWFESGLVQQRMPELKRLLEPLQNHHHVGDGRDEDST